ncbi:hypothetical protein ILUMI_12701 [Ignelater luminosus]|uniref:Uncharacterized protein n=1 Tax=Ignelater luminosus TaxID=2038154 RepID=A0A8K0D2A2_IGNLU|nr:hypothetical protein ILUMI_12701 [Ignelater luminosus]
MLEVENKVSKDPEPLTSKSAETSTSMNFKSSTSKDSEPSLFKLPLEQCIKRENLTKRIEGSKRLRLTDNIVSQKKPEPALESRRMIPTTCLPSNPLRLTKSYSKVAGIASAPSNTKPPQDFQTANSPFLHQLLENAAITK